MTALYITTLICVARSPCHFASLKIDCCSSFNVNVSRTDYISSKFSCCFCYFIINSGVTVSEYVELRVQFELHSIPVSVVLRLSSGKTLCPHCLMWMWMFGSGVGTVSLLQGSSVCSCSLPPFLCEWIRFQCKAHSVQKAGHESKNNTKLNF